MAGGNQGQGQGQGRRNEGRNEGHNGGGGQTPRDQPKDVVQNVREGVEQVGSRLREGYDTAREDLTRRYRRTEGTIARNPTPSVLIGFGIGFGLGLALTASLLQRDESWADDLPGDWGRRLPSSVRHPKVPDSVRDAHVPESVHHTLHHLADTLRDLPASIAKMVHR